MSDEVLLIGFGPGHLSLMNGRPNEVLSIGFWAKLFCDILATFTQGLVVMLDPGLKA